MKILGSYKKMMYEFINEDDEKVYQTDSGKWAGDYEGDIEYFDDKEKAQHWSEKGDMDFDDDSGDSKDDEDSAGKLSGKSDFSRDGDEPEAEPKSEPSPDDGDKPAKTKPEDFTNDLAGDEEAGQLANRLAQEYPDDDPEDIEKELTDMGHGDLAKAIRNADSLEDKAALISKATEAPDDDMSDEEERIEREIENLNDKIQSMMNDYDPDTDAIMKLVKKKEDLEDKLYGESITINGQKYKEIKESKKKPNPHILKENYDRIFRSLK